MQQKVEIKVAYTCQRGVRWEDIPVTRIVWDWLLEDTLDDLTTQPDVFQVRWNYEGSPQGHYVFGAGSGF